MRATCLAHLTLPDFIVLRGKIFGEHKLWSSLCTSVYFFVTSSVLGESKYVFEIKERSHLYNLIEVLKAANGNK
jgi:hypothetical protein